MTEITHEALNEIADALRRGCDGSIPIEAAEKLECIADALRTGQLIHAVPSGDEVEAVARAIDGADKQEGTIASAMDFDWVKDMRMAQATAAITALDAHRGKQANA